MAAEATRRLFFALWPPAGVALRLHDVALTAQRACGGRAMRRETLHITLAFLGDVAASRLSAAEGAAASVAGAACVLELDRLAYWKRNRIVWAGCSALPPVLDRLAGDLAQSLRGAGFQLETRPFAAHATLLRNADAAAGVPAFAPPIAWPVEDFALVGSSRGADGSRYEVLRRWPLAAAID